jgi:hypothetical protein
VLFVDLLGPRPDPFIGEPGEHFLYGADFFWKLRHDYSPIMA